MADSAISQAEGGLEVKDIIEQASGWRLSDRPHYYTAQLPDFCSVTLHISDIVSADERLAAVMPHIVSADHGDADAIRVTLKLWANPQPFLRQFVLEKHHYPTAIDDWLESTTNGYARLAVMHYSIDTLMANRIPFANGFNGRFVLVIPHGELETAYPGCVQRHQCLQSLGLRSEALMAQVFGAPVSAADVELPDLVNDIGEAGL